MHKNTHKCKYTNTYAKHTKNTNITKTQTNTHTIKTKAQCALGTIKCPGARQRAPASPQASFLESSSGAKCSLKITLSAVRQSRTFCHILTFKISSILGLACANSTSFLQCVRECVCVCD